MQVLDTVKIDDAVFFGRQKFGICSSTIKIEGDASSAVKTVSYLKNFPFAPRSGRIFGKNTIYGDIISIYMGSRNGGDGAIDGSLLTGASSITVKNTSEDLFFAGTYILLGENEYVVTKKDGLNIDIYPSLLEDIEDSATLWLRYYFVKDFLIVGGETISFLQNNHSPFLIPITHCAYFKYEFVSGHTTEREIITSCDFIYGEQA